MVIVVPSASFSRCMDKGRMIYESPTQKLARRDQAVFALQWSPIYIAHILSDWILPCRLCFDWSMYDVAGLLQFNFLPSQTYPAHPSTAALTNPHPKYPPPNQHMCMSVSMIQTAEVVVSILEREVRSAGWRQGRAFTPGGGGGRSGSQLSIQRRPVCRRILFCLVGSSCSFGLTFPGTQICRIQF